jgi:hypothetical protein
MNDGRDSAGRFGPGNPGRPKGARNVVSAVLDQIADGHADTILAAVIKAAEEGDPRSAELILKRVWPEPRGRPIAFDIPPVLDDAHHMVTKVRALIASVASGQLSPEEANQVATLLDLERKVIEVSSLEERIQALEKTQRGRQD